MELITTESGSTYLVDRDRIKRISNEEMRRDGEWIQVRRWVAKPREGKKMKMILEPLSDLAVATLRTTTVVVNIEEMC